MISGAECAPLDHKVDRSTVQIKRSPAQQINRCRSLTSKCSGTIFLVRRIRGAQEEPQTPSFPVAIGAGSHPFPFRTRKLSLLPPMVLPAQVGGRVGRCRGLITKARFERVGPFSLYSVACFCACLSSRPRAYAPSGYGRDAGVAGRQRAGGSRSGRSWPAHGLRAPRCHSRTPLPPCCPARIR
jgi:hypothetical protein